MNPLTSFALEIAKNPVLAAATNTANTRIGQDGGYAVPIDAAKMIFAPEVGALLPLCAQLPVTQGGSLELPVDLSTAYDETGIIAGWEREVDEIDVTTPNLKRTLFTLKKLIVLTPVTDELLADSAALAAYLPLALQTAITRQVNEAIISGPGVARPLGILNSAATISVSKEGAQAAGTVVDGNVKTMLARALNPAASTWIANPALYAQIIGLAAWDASTRTLAGLPLVLADAAPAPGNRGDLILGDLSGYVAALKNPGLHMSSHLWFDQDISAFRLTFRMDGMPALSGPLTPPNATTTKSHFVTLAERS